MNNRITFRSVVHKDAIGVYLKSRGRILARPVGHSTVLPGSLVRCKLRPTTVIVNDEVWQRFE